MSLCFLPDERWQHRHFLREGSALSATRVLQEIGCKARLQAENSKLRGYFLANRQGDLQTTAAASGHAQGTRPRLPLLQVARAHSYADLGTSGTDDCTQPVLFNKRER
jgi:hypothetical protein